jgi:hypothetical protein
MQRSCLTHKDKAGFTLRLRAFSVAIFAVGIMVILLGEGTVLATTERPRGTARKKTPPSPSLSKAERETGVFIQLDPSVPLAPIRAAGYRVQSHGNLSAQDPWREPSPTLRDRLFAETGIVRWVSTWDHFDKDLLFTRAQDLPLATLAKKYPKISNAMLADLVKRIQREKAARPAGSVAVGEGEHRSLKSQGSAK